MPGSLTETIAQGNQLHHDPDRTGNEQETRHVIIDPLLEHLGWDKIDVRQEHPVQIGSTTKYIDSLLCIDATNYAILEAKALSTTLTEQHVQQLRSYMLVEWVPIGVLTNGLEYQLYYLETSEDGQPTATPVLSETLDTFPNSTLETLLTKENITSGATHEQIEQLVQSDTVETWLRNNTEKVAYARRTTDRQSSTEEFIDALFTARRTHHAEVDESQPDYRVELADGDSAVTVGGDTQADAMAALVSHLIDHHNLLDRVELPYTGIGHGEMPLIANGQPPAWKNDDRGYIGNRHLGNNIHVCTHFGRDAKQRHITRLCNHIGAPTPTFTGHW